MKACPFCAEEIQDAAIVCKHCGRELAAGRRRGVAWYLFRGALVVVVSGAIFGLMAVRRTDGRRALAVAVQAPITITDEVNNLPAASWKAFPLILPYSGRLTVSVNVLRGNPLDLVVASVDDLNRVKRGSGFGNDPGSGWDQLQASSTFTATKTKTFRRMGTLSQGGYVLLVRDTSLGVLSARATDVEIKASLNP